MRTRRLQSGISLLELVIAVAVFAVAFLMLLTAFPTAARAIHQGDQYLVATFLAERRLEEIRSLDFDSVVETGADPGGAVAVPTSNQGVASNLEYSIQTKVQELEPNLKRVRVVVSWTADRARYVEVLTDVARIR